MAKQSLEDPDPFRKIDRQEIAEYIDDPRFDIPSHGQDAAKWREAVQQIRAAIGHIDFDALPSYSKDRHRLCRFDQNVCSPIDRQVKKSEQIDRKLLTDPIIQAVRREIALRISIRFILGTREDFWDFIRELQSKGGKVVVSELKKSRFLRFIEAIYRVIYDFGDQMERKQLAWTLIAEFLSKYAGVKVEFEGQYFVNRRRKKDFLARGDPLMDSGSFERTFANLERTGSDFVAFLKRALGIMDSILAAMPQKVSPLSDELKRCELDIVAVQAELVPYYEEMQKLADSQEAERRAGAIRLKKPIDSFQLSERVQLQWKNRRSNLIRLHREKLGTLDRLETQRSKTELEINKLREFEQRVRAERGRFSLMIEAAETDSPRSNRPNPQPATTAAPEKQRAAVVDRMQLLKLAGKIVNITATRENTEFLRSFSPSIEQGSSVDCRIMGADMKTLKLVPQLQDGKSVEIPIGNDAIIRSLHITSIGNPVVSQEKKSTPIKPDSFVPLKDKEAVENYAALRNLHERKCLITVSAGNLDEFKKLTCLRKRGRGKGVQIGDIFLFKIYVSDVRVMLYSPRKADGILVIENDAQMGKYQIFAETAHSRP